MAATGWTLPSLLASFVTFMKKPGDVVVKVGNNHGGRADVITSMDPFEWVISANIHRRHLTAEQKRDIIAAVLKAQPENLDRSIERARRQSIDGEPRATQIR